MSAWSHLPNTAHIDTILVDVKARPGVWIKAGKAVWGTAWVRALYAAQDTAESAARDAALSAAWGAARAAAWDIAGTIAEAAAWDAIRALIAWPESAALLDLTPDALRTLIDVADGDVKHQAVLLLPAVIARGVS